MNGQRAADEGKHDHEQRIRRLTEIKEDPQTHILILQAPIDGRPTRINPTDAVRAVLPKYPVEEHPWLIDPGGIGLPADSIGFFPMLAESITSQTRELLARRAGGTSITCLSVFALAPVPLLVHFGHLLGDMEQVDLYQRHRDTQDWTWKEEEATDVFYEVLKPDAPSSGLSEVALLLSVSETVNQNRVAKTLGCEPQFYEIRARDPNRDFLRSRKRLELFEYEVRKLLFELRDSHAHECAIHLFAAVPAPMAIAFGRCIKDFDAPFQLYEYRKNDRSFISALTINSRQRRRHD